MYTTFTKTFMKAIHSPFTQMKSCRFLVYGGRAVCVETSHHGIASYTIGTGASHAEREFM
jgi:hypothetical protein